MSGRVTLFPGSNLEWGCDFENKIGDLSTIVGDFSFALQCDPLDVKVGGASIFKIEASTNGKVKDKGTGPSMQIANKMDIITTMAAASGANPVAMMKTAKRVAQAAGKVISTAASGDMTQQRQRNKPLT